MRNRDITFVIRVRNEARQIFRRFGADLRGAARASRNLADETRKASDAFRRNQRQVRETSRSYREAKRSAGGLASSWRTLLQLAGPLTAALSIGAVVSDATQQTLGFETALSRVEGLVGIAGEQVQEFGQDILALSGEVGQAPRELADALFFVTSAGARGSEAIDILEASAKAGAAGLGETRDVAFAAVSALNAFHGTGLTASDAVDTLVASVREGNLEASDLASSIGRILPQAAEAGVGLNQVGATVAALTKGGLGASEAVTQLRGVLTAVTRASREGQPVLAAAGTSFAEIRKNIRERGLLEALVQLRNDLGGNTTALTRVLGSVEAVNLVLSLTGSQLEDTRDIFAAVADATGATESAFGVFAATTEGQLARAVSAVRARLVELGDNVLPALAQATLFLSENFEELQLVVTVLAAVFAARFIFQLIRATSGMLTMIPVVGKLIVNFRRLRFAIAATGIGLLMTSLPQVVEAFDGLNAQVTEGVTRFMLLRAAGEAVFGELIRIVRSFLEGFGFVGRAIQAALDLDTDAFRQNAGQARDAFVGAFTGTDFEGAVKERFREVALAAREATQEGLAENAAELEVAAEQLGIGAGDALVSGFQQAVDDFGGFEKLKSSLNGLIQEFLPGVARAREQAEALRVLEVASQGGADALAALGISQAQLDELTRRVTDGIAAEKDAVDKAIESVEEKIRVAGLDRREQQIQLAVSRARRQAIEKEGEADEARLAVLEERLRLEQRLRSEQNLRRNVDNQLQQIRDQVRLIGVEGLERERLTAIINLENEARAAGIDNVAGMVAELNAEFDGLRRRQRELEGDAFGGIAAGIRAAQDEVANLRSQFREITDSGIDGLTDAFVAFAETGKLSFNDLANSIIADFTRIAARQAAVGLAGSVFGAFGGGEGTAAAGAGGGIGGFDFGFLADVFEDGGIVSQTRQVRQLVRPEMFRHAPRFTTGGRVPGLTSGQVPVIADAGEVILNAAGQRNVAERMAAPLQVVVNVTINTPDVDGFRRSQGQIAAQLGTAIDRAVQRNT